MKILHLAYVEIGHLVYYQNMHLAGHQYKLLHLVHHQIVNVKLLHIDWTIII